MPSVEEFTWEVVPQPLWTKSYTLPLMVPSAGLVAGGLIGVIDAVAPDVPAGGRGCPADDELSLPGDVVVGELEGAGKVARAEGLRPRGGTGRAPNST